VSVLIAASSQETDRVVYWTLFQLDVWQLLLRMFGAYTDTATDIACGVEYFRLLSQPSSRIRKRV
jgi:hypothetical protein